MVPVAGEKGRVWVLLCCCVDMLAATTLAVRPPTMISACTNTLYNTHNAVSSRYQHQGCRTLLNVCTK